MRTLRCIAALAAWRAHRAAVTCAPHQPWQHSRLTAASRLPRNVARIACATTPRRLRISTYCTGSASWFLCARFFPHAYALHMPRNTPHVTVLLPHYAHIRTSLAPRLLLPSAYQFILSQHPLAGGLPRCYIAGLPYALYRTRAGCAGCVLPPRLLHYTAHTFVSSNLFLHTAVFFVAFAVVLVVLYTRLRHTAFPYTHFPFLS